MLSPMGTMRGGMLGFIERDAFMALGQQECERLRVLYDAEWKEVNRLERLAARLCEPMTWVPLPGGGKSLWAGPDPVNHVLHHVLWWRNLFMHRRSALYTACHWLRKRKKDPTWEPKERW